MGQILLSRLSKPMHEVAHSLRLTRLYNDWPALSFEEVGDILDREIPKWREEFQVEAQPLGVASMAQVHGAKDRDGQEWVIKILKPEAKKRHLETLDAVQYVVKVLQPVALTMTMQKALKETNDMCRALRRETDLSKEKNVILNVREKLGKRQKLLMIPRVKPDFCSNNVLTIERFHGTPISEVVSGNVQISAAMRQKLARKMLNELLVQVFEHGLFHADPHAGNLMLLENGSVGLYDWGLSGELLETDRKHIAGMLRAILSLDLDGLIEVLQHMGKDSGRVIPPEEIKKELKTVMSLIKKSESEEAEKPSIQKLIDACLSSASRLGIEIPDGLSMMAKCLITIEGLAKGIDPDVSMARAATPVLLRAAKPRIKDLIKMGSQLPKVAKMVLGGDGK